MVHCFEIRHLGYQSTRHMVKLLHGRLITIMTSQVVTELFNMTGNSSEVKASVQHSSNYPKSNQPVRPTETVLNQDHATSICHHALI